MGKWSKFRALSVCQVSEVMSWFLWSVKGEIVSEH